MSDAEAARLLEDVVNRARDERDAVRDYAEVRPVAHPQQVYSLVVPAERLEELRWVADRTGEPIPTILRRWALERLEEEATNEPEAFRRMAEHLKVLRSCVLDLAGWLDHEDSPAYDAPRTFDEARERLRGAEEELRALRAAWARGRP